VAAVTTRQAWYLRCPWYKQHRDLVVRDRPVAAVGLLLWCAGVVSWIDNLIRPLVISNQTRIPFLLVLFGVLGGSAHSTGGAVCRAGDSGSAAGDLA
jgi:hypothetical protein